MVACCPSLPSRAAITPRHLVPLPARVLPRRCGKWLVAREMSSSLLTLVSSKSVTRRKLFYKDKMVEVATSTDVVSGICYERICCSSRCTPSSSCATLSDLPTNSRPRVPLLEDYLCLSKYINPQLCSYAIRIGPKDRFPSMIQPW
jgi:hypothetical protein